MTELKNDMTEHQFFMAMIPPTVTHQEKQIRIITPSHGRPFPQYYEPPSLKEVRQKLTNYLCQHKLPVPWTGPIRLYTKWCFQATKQHKKNTWRITKPDTDNLQKLLKDCMTDVGFWDDDAQVCSEIVEKFWSDIPGIWIRMEKL